MIPNAVIQRAGRWGIWTLSALLVVAIASAAARLTWSLAGQTGVPVLDIATAFAAPRRREALDLTPIVVLAPFGARAVVPAIESVAEETSLGFVLHGVVVAAPRDSIALIASNNGRAELYGVGDAIEGKATVIEVLDDKVMLQVGGSVETLSFPTPGEKKSGVANIVAGITNSGVTAPSSAPQPSTPIIEEYRRKIAANPQSMLDSFGVSASPNGYTVDQNATSALLRTGLRPGDLIAKVNGEAVGDIESDRRLMDTIIASGQLRVEVVRQGRSVFMSFPLK